MTNTSLKDLELSSNQITSRGFLHFAAILPWNQTFEIFDLSGNLADRQARLTLIAAAKKGKTLKKVDLISEPESYESSNFYVRSEIEYLFSKYFDIPKTLTL
mmetsp:Transcript_18475/g.20954  ORF Transcript_18475/g.20954 Transcript_18475/m.20954 type:complete len:102 (+) Transcript_18475:1667-1972(+)